ncbi:MAG TPA: phosphatase PAP2 family protein, partial [Flavisolibacter sp.]|nr:phosphatase PAP2 family protein [Flavisolibacter sp.]
MKSKIAALAILCLLFNTALLAQKPDTLIHKLDSLSKKKDSAGKQINNTNPSAYNEKTKFTFPSYFILLGSDLKQAFTKPFHMSSKDWKLFGGFLLVEGAVAFLDEPIQRQATKVMNQNSGFKGVSTYVTDFGGTYEVYTLASLGAYGFLFKNEKMQTTTLLATQAYITGGAIESVLKFLSGRQRPNYYDRNTLEAEPKFHGPFARTGTDINGNRLNSSFPSGHTTVAFAAATVFAKEYHDRPWVPILAYSAATLIGVSRITENKHW